MDDDDHRPELPPGAIAAATLLDLRARADEHHRRNALLRDPLAARWTTLLPPRDDPSAPYDGQIQTRLAVRARAFDDATDRFLRPRDIRRHLIQRRYLRAVVQPVVVELGGGLSTRYHRIGKGRARWVEGGLPDMIALRRRLEAESFEHRFLAGSPTDPGWLSQLPDISPTELLFIAEGVQFHVDSVMLRVLAAWLRERFAGATVLLHSRDWTICPGPRDWLSEGEAHCDSRSVCDEANVAALGLRPIRVQPLALEYPDRTSEIVAPQFLPPLRDVGVLVEAIVEPFAE